MNNCHCMECKKEIKIGEEFKWKKSKTLLCIPCYNKSKKIKT